MAGHLFQFPSGGPYTDSIELSPALVMIHEQQIMPIQRLAEVETGAILVYELHSNERQPLDVLVTDLHEADVNSLSGFTSLQTFIRTVLNYSQHACDFTHTDGDFIVLRYISGVETFREGRFGLWSGQLRFMKVLS